MQPITPQTHGGPGGTRTPELDETWITARRDCRSATDPCTRGVGAPLAFLDVYARFRTSWKGLAGNSVRRLSIIDRCEGLTLHAACRASRPKPHARSFPCP